MKTTACTFRPAKTTPGIVLVLFLIINLYSGSFSSSEKPSGKSGKEQWHANQRNQGIKGTDSYLAKADSTQDYINIIGMTCMKSGDHSILSYTGEGRTDVSENSNVSKKNTIAVSPAGNKSILNMLFIGSALYCNDQYLT